MIQLLLLAPVVRRHHYQPRRVGQGIQSGCTCGWGLREEPWRRWSRRLHKQSSILPEVEAYNAWIDHIYEEDH